MSEYRYKIEGSAAGGQSWVTEGVVDAPFPQIFHTMMRDSFEQLTGGRAVYGKPGLGCNGPYKITKITLEERLQ